MKNRTCDVSPPTPSPQNTRDAVRVLLTHHVAGDELPAQRLFRWRRHAGPVAKVCVESASQPRAVSMQHVAHSAAVTGASRPSSDTRSNAGLRQAAPPRTSQRSQNPQSFPEGAFLVAASTWRPPVPSLPRGSRLPGENPLLSLPAYRSGSGRVSMFPCASKTIKRAHAWPASPVRPFVELELPLQAYHVFHAERGSFHAVDHGVRKTARKEEEEAGRVVFIVYVWVFIHVLMPGNSHWVSRCGAALDGAT